MRASLTKDKRTDLYLKETHNLSKAVSVTAHLEARLQKVNQHGVSASLLESNNNRYTHHQFHNVHIDMMEQVGGRKMNFSSRMALL